MLKGFKVSKAIQQLFLTTKKCQLGIPKIRFSFFFEYLTDLLIFYWLEYFKAALIKLTNKGCGFKTVLLYSG